MRAPWQAYCEQWYVLDVLYIQPESSTLEYHWAIIPWHAVAHDEFPQRTSYISLTSDLER